VKDARVAVARRKTLRKEGIAYLKECDKRIVGWWLLGGDDRKSLKELFENDSFICGADCLPRNRDMLFFLSANFFLSHKR
jgi:hypothetical protein